MWKILVVDDEAINRKLVKEVLIEKAVCVLVEGGLEAVEAFRQSVRENQRFDAILLDVAMPEVDGIETLRRIREIEESMGVPLGQGIPVIMVTAFSKPFMQSFRQGADDYLLKPIDTDELVKKVEKAITRPSAD